MSALCVNIKWHGLVVWDSFESLLWRVITFNVHLYTVAWISATMYWQAEYTPVDCVMMKGMTQKKVAPLMMNQESEHWSLQHAQLTLYADHGWLHCATIKMRNTIQFNIWHLILVAFPSEVSIESIHAVQPKQTNKQTNKQTKT